MENEEIRSVLLVGLEYSYLHDSWVNPLSDALAGVTVEQAVWRPGEGMKGIWEIVLHLALWNENIIERIESGEPVRAPGGVAWPPLPTSTSEGEWEAAKERLWNSLAALSRLVETAPISKLQAAPYGMGDLLCRFIHNGYHIGQITKLRECAGFD